MRLLQTEQFNYKNNELYCEDVPIRDIMLEYGTPLYVYSKDFFKERFHMFADAFKILNHTIYFATKSNFNINVMKIFADMGAGIDVNSAGELYRALVAGIHPSKLILTGVGKTAEEIRMGLEKGVRLIKAESMQEIELIDKIAGVMKMKAPVAIRVNPDVDPQTHPYITTGLAEGKFGIDSNLALDVYMKAQKLENIDLNGIDMHIGSQIKSVEPFVEAVDKLGELTIKLREKGIRIDHFDIGGGMGVKYLDEEIFDPYELAKAISPRLKELNVEVLFEPGRFLTANGGILATEILYRKQSSRKNFLIVDASMAELLRPSIYGAYHHIQPVELENGRETITADIVGPVCETSDFLGKERDIDDLDRGDTLAIMTAGAYGMTMSSNYNARRRPAEVIVDGDKFYSTRSRENFDHLLWDEKIVDELH
jgi:diaminopimelate decarboxylase